MFYIRDWRNSKIVFMNVIMDSFVWIRCLRFQVFRVVISMYRSGPRYWRIFIDGMTGRFLAWVTMGRTNHTKAILKAPDIQGKKLKKPLPYLFQYIGSCPHHIQSNILLHDLQKLQWKINEIVWKHTFFLSFFSIVCIIFRKFWSIIWSIRPAIGKFLGLVWFFRKTPNVRFFLKLRCIDKIFYILTLSSVSFSPKPRVFPRWTSIVL